MFLFIDTLSVKTCILLFNEKREVAEVSYEDFHHKEFDELPEAIDELLGKRDICYEDLSGIVVLVGPGGFTGTRVTCLVANSIAFAKKVPLHPLHYFDFLDLQNTPFPHVIQANKREVMIRTQTQYTVSLRDVVDLDPDDYYGTADAIAFGRIGATLVSDVDYDLAVQQLDLSDPVQRVDPVYIKDPNIILRSS